MLGPPARRICADDAQGLLCQQDEFRGARAPCIPAQQCDRHPDLDDAESEHRPSMGQPDSQQDQGGARKYQVDDPTQALRRKAAVWDDQCLEQDVTHPANLGLASATRKHHNAE